MNATLKSAGAIISFGVMAISTFAGTKTDQTVFGEKQAKAAIESLNKNWYSPCYRQWMEADEDKPLSAWHAWNMLEQFINYTKLTDDNAYIPIINTVASNPQLNAQGVANGNDDCEWQAIAQLLYYSEIIKDPIYLFEVNEIFKLMKGDYWDDTMGGGIYWDHNKSYKNAITNELFLVIVTKLYLVTGDQIYLDWANKEWAWFEKSGMINSDFLVNDGLDNKTGKNNGETTWTYNQGVILGGLTNLYLISKDEKYLALANKIADSTIKNMTTNGILVEPGTVDDSRKQFKGIFMRYLAYLAVNEKDKAKAVEYKKFINANGQLVWEKRGEGDKFSYFWEAPDKEYDAVKQSSAIDLFNACIAVNKLIIE